jgi:tetratricopeptide (TPR) repeat protein
VSSKSYILNFVERIVTVTPLFEAAVLFCSRRDVRDAVKDVLKAMGVTGIGAPTTAEDCIESLKKDPEALLVIDWEIGGAEVTKVFEAVKGNNRIETRPILLLAAEVSAKLVSIGYEYAVTQTHTGQISQARIKECLVEVHRHEKNTAPLKQILSKVSEARSQNKWDIATTLLETMKDKLPGNARISVELAENLVRSENWNEAIQLLKPFSLAQPPYARALHLLGRCQVKLGQFDEATATLTKAKLLNPFNISRLIDLGNCLMKNDEVAEAKKNFAEAGKLDPKDKAAKVGTGQCMLLEGDVNDALLILKDMTDTQELAAIFNVSAVMAIRAGRFKHGMSLYDSACRAIGADSKVKARLLYNKGLGFQRQKQGNPAIALFQEAIALDANFNKAKRTCGNLLKKMGLPVPADLEAFLTENPAEGSSPVKSQSGGQNQSRAEAADPLSIDFDDQHDDMDDEAITFI